MFFSFSSGTTHVRAIIITKKSNRTAGRFEKYMIDDTKNELENEHALDAPIIKLLQPDDRRGRGV